MVKSEFGQAGACIFSVYDGAGIAIKVGQPSEIINQCIEWDSSILDSVKAEITCFGADELIKVEKKWRNNGNRDAICTIWRSSFNGKR